jgi:lysophospholipase L1-like esterase
VVGTEVVPGMTAAGNPVGIPVALLVQDGGVSSGHILDTGNPHSVTKAQVGLGNADNTSDVNKPISAATQTALDGLDGALSDHEANTGNPHSVTKAQVGLGNADNTSDVNKPISTATQTALDGLVSKAVVGDMDFDLPGVLMGFRSETTGNILATIQDDPDGVALVAPIFQADKVRASTLTVGNQTSEQLDFSVHDFDDPAPIFFMDSTGKIIAKVGAPDTVAAFSEVAPASWGSEYIRLFRSYANGILVGDASKISIAFIGDSWTYNWTYWVQAFAEHLMTELGDGGEGWIGFSSHAVGAFPDGSALNRSAPTLTGTWASSSAGANAPAIRSVTSSTAGDLVSLTTPTGTTGATLFALPGGSGVVRFRVAAGSWTTVNLTGSDPIFSPVTISGSQTLEVEVVSGTCTLLGLLVTGAATGVVCHKLGGSGTRLEQWLAADATSWQTQIAEIAPDTVQILMGTNDQAVSSPTVFQADLTALIGRIRTAVPLADILIVVPPENDMGRAQSMAELASAAFEAAKVTKSAFINLQEAFGPDVSFYRNAVGSTSFLHSDGVHPSTKGGRAIIAALRAMLQI